MAEYSAKCKDSVTSQSVVAPHSVVVPPSVDAPHGAVTPPHLDFGFVTLHGHLDIACTTSNIFERFFNHRIVFGFRSEKLNLQGVPASLGPDHT